MVLFGDPAEGCRAPAEGLKVNVADELHFDDRCDPSTLAASPLAPGTRCTSAPFLADKIRFVNINNFRVH